MARIAKCSLESITYYSQGKYYDAERVPKKEGENMAQYEIRTWRNRMHFDESGEVFIPCAQFKNAIKAAAKFKSKQIPGQGKTTYTKHFQAGVIVLDNTPIGIHKDDVESEQVFIGPKGIGKVMKTFPRIEEWKAEVHFWVLDDAITKDIFDYYIGVAGSLIGIGRYRPYTGDGGGGHYGRFKCNKITWKTED